MAKAFQCDRCGEFEQGDPIAGVTFSLPATLNENSSARKTEACELCTQCLAALQDWRAAGLVNQDEAVSDVEA